ncbi:flavin reductase family protein [Streptomyces johnsoniae]|uniref:Flavin reductase family protein n=1 Tax=Streptomyces johnsoniae TaxID=3075532 RepID=A0ABU2SFW2_9ACTN|nr:flavin reductase family protein [Streptomyces sp. DSM 41886]MDT0446655.1 flavin reductase family protein [Streptomyces sp. DSM 41886]
MQIDTDGFRSIFGALPTAVAVVTAIDGEGNPRGLTTNTVTALSVEPPMLLVCLDEESTTLPAVHDAGHFVVNFLADSGGGISQTFAGKADDKFAGLRQRPAARAAGAPVLADDIVAHAECEVHSTIRAGDHTIVVGLVRDGAVYDRTPLMYHRRQYFTWPPRQLAATGN